MGTMRHARLQKSAGCSLLSANIIVERMKKIRALNSSPSLFGIDSLVLRKISKNMYIIVK